MKQLLNESIPEPEPNEHTINEVLPESKADENSKQIPAKFNKFYKVTYDKDKEVKRIHIEYLALVRILRELGFKRYDLGDEKFIIRVIDNVATQCTQNDVIDAFEEYLMQWDRMDEIPDSDGLTSDYLRNVIYSKLGAYFSDTVLNRLRSSDEIIFLEDTKTESFFCFKDGVICVTKDEIKKISYDKLKDKHIWKNQILPHSIELQNREQFINFPFAKFVSNVSNNYDKIAKKSVKDLHRFNSFETVIGYNLHRYYEGKLKATIFTDSTITDTPDGRTGKTLLTKAIGKMLNKDKWAKTYIELNGKNFDFTDKFRYQECGLDTKLVHINDAKKNFDFEQLFNDISEGIRAQKKGQTPFGVNAKIILSTNRTIKVNGGSAKDRAVEIEMSSYYSSGYSPLDDFGHWFFTDWSGEQWNCFYNFMFNCVKMYLQHGIISPESINLNERKLIEETAIEFVSFMDGRFSDGRTKVDVEFDKKVLLAEFKMVHSDFNKNLKQRTFTKWLRSYAKFRDKYKLLSERDANSVYYGTFVGMDGESSDLPKNLFS
jgi:hypothetical protein